MREFDGEPSATMTGMGFDYGAGIELGSRRVPGRLGARIWVDVGRHHVSYRGRHEEMPNTIFNTFTLGVNVQR